MDKNKQEHFIKNIEIKNFKCFEDFKAEGFGRVNLIGGKNNVGKTAFMEAIAINTYAIRIENFKEILINIKFAREKVNILFNETSVDEYQFIKQHSTMYLKSNLNKVSFEIRYKNGIPELIFQFSEHTVRAFIEEYYRIGKVTNSFLRFIDSFGLSKREIQIAFSSIQKKDKEDFLNQLLHQFDPQIEVFKIIENNPQCKVNNQYLELTELGDGTRQLITILTTMFTCENGYLFIDEIENGIHYTNLDKLWEIILTISKQQNVQVFATTHSKECIESYARVAKRLEDEEIAFIELGRNKENELKAMIYPYEWFLDEIEQNHEVRGW